MAATVGGSPQTPNTQGGRREKTHRIACIFAAATGSGGKECDWMRTGRGSEKAVWIELVEEAARQRGISSAAVPVDLVKAFEQVMLHLVWEAVATQLPA